MSNGVNKIVLDLETQKSFEEVGGRDRNHLLKVSVVGIYSYPLNKYLTFTEDQLYKLGEMLSKSDQIIGFNIKNFDFFGFEIILIQKLAILPDIVIQVFGDFHIIQAIFFQFFDLAKLVIL